MKKRILVGAIAAALSLSLTTPWSASAHQGQGSCAGFGARVSGIARTGELGMIISGFSTSAPGASAAAVAAGHAADCEPARGGLGR